MGPGSRLASGGRDVRRCHADCGSTACADLEHALGPLRQRPHRQRPALAPAARGPSGRGPRHRRAAGGPGGAAHPAAPGPMGPRPLHPGHRSLRKGRRRQRAPAAQPTACAGGRAAHPGSAQGRYRPHRDHRLRSARGGQHTPEQRPLQERPGPAAGPTDPARRGTGRCGGRVDPAGRLQRRQRRPGRRARAARRVERSARRGRPDSHVRPGRQPAGGGFLPVRPGLPAGQDLHARRRSECVRCRA